MIATKNILRTKIRFILLISLIIVCSLAGDTEHLEIMLCVIFSTVVNTLSMFLNFIVFVVHSRLYVNWHGIGIGFVMCSLAVRTPPPVFD